MTEAFALIDAWVASGEVPAISVCVGQGGGTLEKIAGVGPDALFLAASLTKPVVAAATLRLLERGWLTLDEPVASILPEFAGEGRDAVRVRHLLAHTSGLPDMLPDNDDLRSSQAPIERFVAGTCAAPLIAPPGSRSLYSSMGYALLGEIVARLTERPLAEALAQEVFTPLSMGNTHLGVGADRRGRVVPVRMATDAPASVRMWNSAYWLGLGAGWGGLITTAADYARFMGAILGGGTTDDGFRLLGSSATRVMTANQTATFPAVDPDVARLKPWGLGWRLMWPGTSSYFGDLLGPRGFGHWGATGTVAWADPDRDAFAVILTNLPQGLDGAYLARLSNAIVAALG